MAIMAIDDLTETLSLIMCGADEEGPPKSIHDPETKLSAAIIRRIKVNVLQNMRKKADPVPIDSMKDNYFCNKLKKTYLELDLKKLLA